MKRFRLALAALLAMMFTLGGCQKIKDIRVTSFEVESLNIRGLRGVDIVLAVGVDNPSVQVSLTEIEGSLKHSGKVLGELAMSPFTIKARTEQKYQLEAALSVAEGAGLRDLMRLTDPSVLDECKVDFSAKAKIRGTKMRPVKVNDIPLKELLEQVSNEKI